MPSLGDEQKTEGTQSSRLDVPVGEDRQCENMFYYSDDN